MPSIRDLKKDINFVLGDIIEAVYIWEAGSGNKESEEGTGGNVSGAGEVQEDGSVGH